MNFELAEEELERKEELFKELSSSTEVNDFKYFLTAKGLVK